MGYRVKTFDGTDEYPEANGYYITESGVLRISKTVDGVITELALYNAGHWNTITPFTATVAEHDLNLPHYFADDGSGTVIECPLDCPGHAQVKRTRGVSYLMPNGGRTVFHDAFDWVENSGDGTLSIFGSKKRLIATIPAGQWSDVKYGVDE